MPKPTASGAIGQRLKRLLPKNRFARSVSVLAGGTAAGQIIIVAASPLLTRLYSPEDFGLLAVYAGLLGILSVVASLRYQLAIPLPESDEEASSVVVLSLLVMLGMTALCAIIVALWGGAIANILNVPALESYLWLLPLGLMLAGTYQVLNFWAIRVKAFPAIAQTKLTQALSSVVIQISASPFGPIALLVGQIAGQAAGVTRLTAGLIKSKRAILRAPKASILVSVKRLWRFPIYSTWGGLFNAASVNAPVILFSMLFSPSLAGHYFLAQRVVLSPVRLIGLSVAQVFYGEFEERIRKGNLSEALEKTHRTLAVVALPPALLLAAGGEFLFSNLFGEAFARSGFIAQLLAPWMYLELTTAPIKKTLTALDNQLKESLWELSLFFFRVLSIIIGSIVGSAEIAVGLLSLVSSIHYIVLLILIGRLTSCRLLPFYWFRTSLPFKVATGFALCTVFISFSLLNTIISLSLAFAIAALIAYVISLKQLNQRSDGYNAG